MNEKILAAFRQFGVSEQDAMQVLGIVATELHKSERIEKARKVGLTVEELDNRDLGRSVASRLNKKLGYGQKGAQ